MKNIKEFKEPDQEFDAHGPNDFNSSSIASGSHLEQLRQEFAYLAGQPQVTINVAITKIRKILAQYNIFIDHDLPRFAEDSGEYFFQVYQHDSDIRIWEKDKGEIYGKPYKEAPTYVDQDNFYLYLVFELNPRGFFDVMAQIVSEDELSEIVGDDEIEDF